MAFKNKEKEKVSLINFLSVLGFAALFMLTWLGELFLTGGEMAKSLLLAGGLTLLFVVLLIILVRIKSVSSNFRVWSIVEIVVLLLYVAAAILLSRPTRHFFEVNANKDEIQQQAKKDFNAIRSVFTEYENFENEAISNTRRGILASIGGTRSKELSDFYTAMKINPKDNENVNRYCDIQKEKLLGNKYEQYKKENLTQVDNWDKAVEDWSILRIPEIAKDSEAVKDIVKALSDYSKKADLPVIVSDGKTHDIESTKQAFSMDVPTLGLADKLSAVSPSALILSIVALVLVHLLILMSFFFGYRDAKQGFKKKVREGNTDDIYL